MYSFSCVNYMTINLFLKSTVSCSLRWHGVHRRPKTLFSMAGVESRRQYQNVFIQPKMYYYWMHNITFPSLDCFRFFIK